METINLNKKCIYVGASANFGECNVYQYMIRGFFLGLGYTSIHYGAFTLQNGVRVVKSRDNTKNIWGATQAGVSIVWTIGGN